MAKRLVKTLGTALSRTNKPVAAQGADGLSDFVQGLQTMSLRNEKVGIGTPRDQRVYTQYRHAATTNRIELENTFCNSWLGRRIVSTLPEDMLRAWRKFKWDNLSDDDKNVKLLKTAEKKLKVKKTMLTGLNWARLYGGSLIVPILKSQPDEVLAEPLDLDQIEKDDLVGLRVLDRWRCGHDGTVVTDALSPQNGMPEHYLIAESSVRLHHTRVIRLDGRELPYWRWKANGMWHDSVYQILLGNLKQYDTAVAALTTMMFQVNVDVILQSGLKNLLSTKGGEARAIERFRQFAMSKAFNGIALLDKDTEEFQRHPYTFSGVDKAFDKVMYDVCGAADVPFTRLFGQSPAGMNATGESDTRNYYDHVGARREEQVDDALQQLDEFLLRSTLGQVPDGYAYEWNPLWQESAAEAASAELVRAQTAQIYQTVGAIDEGVVAGDLYARGVYSSMTQDHVKNAEELAKEPDPVPTVLPNGKTAMLPPKAASKAPVSAPKAPKEDDA